MPPRYQLTLRDIQGDEEVGTQANTSPESRSRSQTPRSARPRSPAAKSLTTTNTRSKQHVTLTSCGGSDEGFRKLEAGSNTVLPARHSSYISNRKNQMQLNSARRQLDEGLLTGPVPQLGVSKKTVAPFPVTRLANCMQVKDARQSTPAAKCRRQVSGNHHSFAPPGSGRRAVSATSERVHIAVRNVSPFSEVAGGVHFCDQQRNAQRRVGVMGDHPAAALCVERGRVALYRKTKADTTQSFYGVTHALLSSRDDENYLAHLRKLYLNGVRDLAKARDREPDIDRHKTIKERIDYDRKVGRILQYYADVDLPIVCKSGDNTVLPTDLQPTPGLLFYGRQFQVSSARASVHSDSRGVDIENHVPSSSFGQVRSQETLSQTSDFVWHAGYGKYTRINNKATLHKRQFYLHTPARDRHVNGEDGRPDSSSCLCAICRLEMHVALLTRVQAAHCPVETFPIQSPKTSDNPSSGVSQDDSMTTDTRNGQVSVTMKTRACAAVRPQSLASYLHSDPVVLFEDRRSLYAGGGVDARAETAAPEPTSLSVTLPAAGYSISRGTDSGHLEFESEIGESPEVGLQHGEEILKDDEVVTHTKELLSGDDLLAQKEENEKDNKVATRMTESFSDNARMPQEKNILIGNETEAEIKEIVNNTETVARREDQ